MNMNESTALTNFVEYDSMSFSTLHTMCCNNQMDMTESTALTNFVIYNKPFSHSPRQNKPCCSNPRLKYANETTDVKTKQLLFSLLCFLKSLLRS